MRRALGTRAVQAAALGALALLPWVVLGLLASITIWIFDTATAVARVGSDDASTASNASTATSSNNATRGDRRSLFARGVRAFRAGAYDEAEQALTLALGGAGKGAPSGPPLRNADWARYLRAESAFFIGHVSVAREDFEALRAQKGSRFAGLSAVRLADCLWAAGDRAAAVAHYRTLPARPSREIDAGLGRFRVAAFAETQRHPDSRKLFLAFYRDFPRILCRTMRGGGPPPPLAPLQTTETALYDPAPVRAASPPRSICDVPKP